MNNIKDTQNRLDIEQQEPLLKILRLWKTKMLAIRINEITEEIYTIDGYSITNYDRENRTSIVINVDNMEGYLAFVIENDDIKTIDGKLPTSTIDQLIMSNQDMQSLKASCINIYIELLQDSISDIKSLSRNVKFFP